MRQANLSLRFPLPQCYANTMRMESVYEKIRQVCSEERIRLAEPMAEHTTFRIGGEADLFVMPKDADEIAALIRICREEQYPYSVVGRGSNLLVSDKGYRGLVICTMKGMETIEVRGEEIEALSGAQLSAIAGKALSHSLTGFEFAAGIPGTLGGAVVMNAGAYGGEMKDVLASADVLTLSGEVKTLSVDELKLGYRRSVIPEENLIVLSAVIKLKEGDPVAIRARMDELKNARLEKQPLNYPSAGSTFKRPKGAFAGKLIMEAGLSGYRVGDAQVSTKHCGFVVNLGHATASDVRQLMEHVKETVYETSGFRLEPEVKWLGEME